MKIIKLTSADVDNAIYVNVNHLITFWLKDSEKTQITLTNKDNFGHVKETPEEIVKLIEFAWKV